MDVNLNDSLREQINNSMASCNLRNLKPQSVRGVQPNSDMYSDGVDEEDQSPFEQAAPASKPKFVRPTENTQRVSPD